MPMLIAALATLAAPALLALDARGMARRVAARREARVEAQAATAAR